MKTRFGVRELPGGQCWEVVAETSAGRCYRLTMAGSDEIGSAGEVTEEHARRLWRSHRRAWLPDFSGGAGVRSLEMKG
jgi:hypothetical protein